MRLLYFAKDGADVLPPDALHRRYGLDPAGVNFYYGLNIAVRDHLRDHGTPFRDNHRKFFDMVRAALRRDAFMVNLGLWPFEDGAPYEFVEDHPELVLAVAKALAGEQNWARAAGKRLDITVRYASEMNDPMKPGQPWGRPHGAWDPAHARPYRDTFRQVRRIFRNAAPNIRFAFSPALRADIAGPRYDMIADFWPGAEWVDVVGGTWYVGQEAHHEAALATLRRHFTDLARHKLPFGLDEVGGIHGNAGNDAALERMLKSLTAAAGEAGVALDYASLFLHGKWTTDATLKFLNK